MKFAVKDRTIDLEKKYLELFIYTWDNNPSVIFKFLYLSVYLMVLIYLPKILK